MKNIEKSIEDFDSADYEKMADEAKRREKAKRTGNRLVDEFEPEVDEYTAEDFLADVYGDEGMDL